MSHLQAIRSALADIDIVGLRLRCLQNGLAASQRPCDEWALPHSPALAEAFQRLQQAATTLQTVMKRFDLESTEITDE